MNNPFQDLLGWKVEVPCPDESIKRGYVAAVDYDKGITIKNDEGKNIACINRMDFERKAHWLTASELGTYDDEFWHMVSAIYGGWYDEPGLKKELGYKYAFICSGDCAFE